MGYTLHPRATTTPRIRKEIQESNLTKSQLARKHGISYNTVKRWKESDTIYDGSCARKQLLTAIPYEEEQLIIFLRTHLRLSREDVHHVLKVALDIPYSVSAVKRCFYRNGINKLPPLTDTSKDRRYQKFETTPFGYVHIDLKQLAKLESKLSYVFVAIERATRHVWAYNIPDKKRKTVAQAFQAFLAQKLYPVHTILTDNGNEFTHSTKTVKNKSHPFDTLCNKHHIEHRLTKPYRPQTNGMVERWNRRLVEAIKQKEYVNERRNRRFHNHVERNQYIMDFVAGYNNTKLKCIDYNSPLEKLAHEIRAYRKGDKRVAKDADLNTSRRLYCIGLV